MSGILPIETIRNLRKFNDLAINMYGIACDIYVPNNLTALEPQDAYLDPATITYTEYLNQKVWVEFFPKDLYRLRKAGVFSENELPITAYFKAIPQVTIKSYIKVPIEYIPASMFVDPVTATSEFEIVDVVMVGTIDAEILHRFKLAPRRKA